MPVILDIGEAKIRRITVQNQPGQNIHETPSQPVGKQGEVVHNCYPSYVESMVQTPQAYVQDPIQKKVIKTKSSGGIAQVVECMLSKCQGPEFKL
jgi:hypothetical protein